MTRRVLNRKARIFSRIARNRLVIVCPSQWLAREAHRSTLCRDFEVRVIPNGIDLTVFRPLARSEARRRLNLPPAARIVLFVADQIEDPRKGLHELGAAFAGVRDVPDILLVTLGRGAPANLPVPGLRHLGPLHDLEQLRAAYSAADVFAMPSLQDNLPNTILESMACGTPVVGFAAGGVSEAVVDGRTGLLAPIGDAAQLARALRRVLEDRPYQQHLAGEARCRVEREYAVDLQARRYASLYGEIMRAQPAGESRRAAAS